MPEVDFQWVEKREEDSPELVEEPEGEDSPEGVWQVAER